MSGAGQRAASRLVAAVLLALVGDGRFEDRRTLTTSGRLRTRPRVTTRVCGGTRIDGLRLHR